MEKACCQIVPSLRYVYEGRKWREITYVFAWDATEKIGHADYLLNQGLGDLEPE